eukprot:15471854-Alexandrium_andersonii.AAC.1
MHEVWRCLDLRPRDSLATYLLSLPAPTKRVMRSLRTARVAQIRSTEEPPKSRCVAGKHLLPHDCWARLEERPQQAMTSKQAHPGFSTSRR